VTRKCHHCFSTVRTVMINTFSSWFTEWAWKMWTHVQCCLDCSWHHFIRRADCRPVLQNASIFRLPTILLLTFPCILVVVSISLLRECKFDRQHCHLLYTATSIGHIGHTLWEWYSKLLFISVDNAGQNFALISLLSVSLRFFPEILKIAFTLRASDWHQVTYVLGFDLAVVW